MLSGIIETREIPPDERLDEVDAKGNLTTWRVERMGLDFLNAYSDKALVVPFSEGGQFLNSGLKSLSVAELGLLAFALQETALSTRSMAQAVITMGILKQQETKDTEGMITGEEAYKVAIALSEKFKTIFDDEPRSESTPT